MPRFIYTTQCGLEIEVSRRLVDIDTAPTVEEISLELGAEHANKTFRRKECAGSNFKLNGNGWYKDGY